MNIIPDYSLAELEREVKVWCRSYKIPLILVPFYLQYTRDYYHATTPQERRKLTLKWKHRKLQPEPLQTISKLTRKFSKRQTK